MEVPRLDPSGRLELLVEIARGGMAELYLGRVNGMAGFEKLVAIKRILPHLADDRQFVEMFLNEGRIAAGLHHPNVCSVFENGELEGQLYLVMEYLRGVSWDALLRAVPLGPERLGLAAGVIAQACDGLHHAHTLTDGEGRPSPVVHRDVSPQNLFVTVEGVCKVLDFGVAKLVKEGPRTRSGVLKGKLPYMSPEQIQGEEVDGRADVFALGVVLWEALAGTSLFDRDTDFLIWKAITEAPIPPLAERGFPPAIDAVILCALERDKQRRFRTARALGEAIRNAVQPTGGALATTGIAEVVRRWCGADIEARAQSIATELSGRRPEPELAPALSPETRAGSTVRLRTDPVPVARPPRRRRWPWLLGAIAVAASVVGILAWRHPREPDSPTARDPVEPADPDEPAPPSIDERRASPADPVESLGRGMSELDHAMTTLDRLNKTAGPLIERYAPEAKAELDRATRLAGGGSAIAATRGALSVDSTPRATIRIDGVLIGPTPLTGVPITSGPHRVKAMRDDGRVQVFDVAITPGVETKLGQLTW